MTGVHDVKQMEESGYLTDDASLREMNLQV